MICFSFASEKMKKGKSKHNNHSECQENNKVSLSNFPDCILLYILSFLSTKEVVQTLILSKRWKNVWKNLPTLTLIASYFNTGKGFTEFVSKVMSLRDASTSLHNLEFRCHDIVDPFLLTSILEYAVSHNVRRLKILTRCDIQRFPTCLFSCHSLTSLHLSVCHPKQFSMCTLFPNSLNLPSLTNLYLCHISFCVGDDGSVEPFSKLTSLTSLMILYCEIVDAQNLCISSTKLVQLTIYMISYAPETYFGIDISTPSLCTFEFHGIPIQKLHRSKRNISSIKHVCIDLITLWNSVEVSLVLLNWLVELANIESLTVSSTTLQVLWGHV